MLGRAARRLRRPNYAEVVATLALFIALGGVSYAAVQIPRNSVGAKQLKRNAVTTKKVKNRSLLARDFKRGQLPRGLGVPQGVSVLMGSSALDYDAEQGVFAPSGNSFVESSVISEQVAMSSPAIAVTASDLSIRLTVPPGNGVTRKLGLGRRTGGTTGGTIEWLLACEITGAARTCTNAGLSREIPEGSELVMNSTVSGGHLPARTDVQFGYTLRR